MNRIVTIALVVIVILFIIAIFISPLVDVLPTALRAQQWLSLILAMFSFSVQIIVCVLPAFVAIALTSSDAQRLRRVCLVDVPCCLLC
ncbi:MAG: hypothetical protein WA354_04405 [Terracidiphilus sp.]